MEAQRKPKPQGGVGGRGGEVVRNASRFILEAGASFSLAPLLQRGEPWNLWPWWKMCNVAYVKRSCGGKGLQRPRQRHVCVSALFAPPAIITVWSNEALILWLCYWNLWVSDKTRMGGIQTAHCFLPFPSAMSVLIALVPKHELRFHLSKMSLWQGAFLNYATLCFREPGWKR